MKQLFNYCPVMHYTEEIEAYPGNLTGYCRDNSLDGIELYLYDLEPFPNMGVSETVGVHLKYWPTWMDFWKQDKARLDKFYPDKRLLRQYFQGASSREEWLEVVRRNIKAALYYEPEYLVWHVAEADLESIFTWSFAYDSKQVLAATVEVFREIIDCVPKNVHFLFENLWWPGLRLTEPLLVGHFFEDLYRIGHENMGIMLDTGHLMNTNQELASEAEGIEYILKAGKALGSLKALVQGFHLSCSLSGSYQRQFLSTVRADKNWHFTTDNMTIMRHIAAIDQHRPFRSVSVKPLVEFFQPIYVNHELYYDSLEEMTGLIKLQRV